jgi:hypothetical protein
MKTLWRALSILCMVGFVAACAPAPTPTPTPLPTEVPTLVPSPTPPVPRAIALSVRDQVTLRFIHAAAGVGDVDVFAGDLAVATRLKFGDGVDGARIAAGEYEITAFNAGTGQGENPLYQSPEPVTLEGGTRYNILLAVVNGVLRLTAIPDDNTPLAGGNARLLFINAAPNTSAVQLGVQGSTPLVESLNFGLSSPPITIGIERLTLQARVDGQVASEYLLNPRENEHYTLVLLPNANGNGARLVEFVSTVPGLAQVRVANGMAAEIGTIDVYLDDEQVAARLAYGSASDLITLTAQPATLRIMRAEAPEAEPLIVTSISPANDDQIVLLLTGGERNAALINYVDDVDVLPSNSASITFVNLYAGAAALRAVAGEGVVQETVDLPYASSPVRLTISAGENNFTWSTPGAPDEEGALQFNDERTFEAGFHYLYILTGRSDAPVLVFERQVEIEEAVVINEDAQVRYINTIEGTNATFSIQDTEVSGIGFAEDSDFGGVAEGDYTVVVNTGAGSANLPVSLQAFSRYSIYAFGTPETPALAIVQNDEMIVEDDNARVRLVQVAPPGGAPMSLAFFANPTAQVNAAMVATPSTGEIYDLPGGLRPIVGGTIPGEHSISARIDAGLYDFFVLDDMMGGVINTLNGIRVNNGEALEIVAVRLTTSSGVAVFAMEYPGE